MVDVLVDIIFGIDVATLLHMLCKLRMSFSSYHKMNLLRLGYVAVAAKERKSFRKPYSGSFGLCAPPHDMETPTACVFLKIPRLLVQGLQ